MCDGIKEGLEPNSREFLKEIKKSGESSKLTELQRLIIRSVDELHEHSYISDETWSSLERYYSENQLMDLVFTVGQYNLVSMALNTMRVKLDDRIASQVQVDFSS